MPRSLPSALSLALLLLTACHEPAPGAEPDPDDIPGTDTPDDPDADDPGEGRPGGGDTHGDPDGDPDTDAGGDPDTDDTATDPDPGDPDPTPACEAWADPVAVSTVADDALDEISDIVPSRANAGVLWVHEDSGADAVLYALDSTGATVGTLTLEGADNHDWEDLSVGPCPDDAPTEGTGDCIWVGDTGDNGLSRDDVAVLTLPEPVLDGETASATLTATPTTWRYAFPDGRGNVEGLAVGADGLPWIVTKRVDATADVYRFPTLDAADPVTLVHIARIDTGDPDDEHPAEATSADLTPDGSRLLVRTYGSLLEYPLVDGVPGAAVALPAPDERQGEAAAYDPRTGGVWLTSEGANPTIWFVGCATG